MGQSDVGKHSEKSVKIGSYRKLRMPSGKRRCIPSVVVIRSIGKFGVSDKGLIYFQVSLSIKGRAFFHNCLGAKINYWLINTLSSILNTLFPEIFEKLKGRCVLLGTVLVLIKLTKNAVPLRFRCGSCKLKFCRYFTMFCDI